MAVIFHLDLDCFFVAAERLRNTRLRGVPVAVGGDGSRGVIASCSYEARKFGVRSAMPTRQALQLCPKLILVSTDFSYYSSLSKQVFSLVDEFTPTFESMGIDEGYLDMTGSGSLFGTPAEAAQKLRAKILAKTGLNASIGIAANRLVAKVATDYCKPDGFFEVEAGKEAEFLAPFPVRVLPGCGKVTESWLNQRGIFRVEELQRFSPETLERHLGKFGSYLYESAWGKGSTTFHEEAKTRGISREMTFDRDISEVGELKKLLWEMCADLGRSLREEGSYARTIKLKLRYPPFETVTRSRVLRAPAQTDLPLYEAVEILFEENWNHGTPLRLLGVGCILGPLAHQLDLFDSQRPDARREGLDHLKDEIRKKFGDRALVTGRDL